MPEKIPTKIGGRLIQQDWNPILYHSLVNQLNSTHNNWQIPLTVTLVDDHEHFQIKLVFGEHI